MDSVKTRLENLASELGMGLSAIGLKIGLCSSTLQATKNSKNGIPSEYLRMIAEEFPQIDMEYMVTGKGSILKTDFKKKERKEEILKKIEKMGMDIVELKKEVRDMEV